MNRHGPSRSDHLCLLKLREEVGKVVTDDDTHQKLEVLSLQRFLNSLLILPTFRDCVETHRLIHPNIYVGGSAAPG